MRFMSCSSSPRGIATVVGVGPRLGCSIARKFAKEGYTVAILARDLAKLSRIADEIAREAKAQVFAIRTDCTDSKSVREAFEGVLSLGFVEVLMYNACGTAATCFAAVSVESFERYLAVSAVGAFHCAQQMLKMIPGMVESGRGTIIFTGSSASLNGFAGYCEQSCGGLLQCLAREFRSAGIHIAHVVIDGSIGIPCRSSRGDGSTGSMDPDAMEKSTHLIKVHSSNRTSHESIIGVACH